MSAALASGDAIAAIATPAGRGGVGVIRISGANLEGWIERLTGGSAPPRRATRARFLDAQGGAIDEGLVLWFPGPASYTGEDVLELQGHGGPVVMRMLLARCVALGARIAEPGEFTRRAYLNDKLDLAQAEGVADLIDAASETAVRSAVRSLSGEFSRRVQALCDQLVLLRTLVEAILDFPEEDIDPLDRADARARLDGLVRDLSALLANAREGSVLRSGVSVVIAGAPNVGKSSLLNRLAGEEVAIVTPVAGTTRDAIRQTVHIDGVPLHIVDTAGVREAGDEVERIGIARTWQAVATADIALLVVDASRGFLPEDEAIAAALPRRAGLLVVHNKIDIAAAAGVPVLSATPTLTPALVPADRRDAAAATSTPIPAPDAGIQHMGVSALTGTGIQELKMALLSLAGWHGGSNDLLLARERHLVALQEAASHLDAARAQAGQAELMAEELRLAHAALTRITGAFSADDLLGEIFGRFCIGK